MSPVMSAWSLQVCQSMLLVLALCISIQHGTWFKLILLMLLLLGAMEKYLDSDASIAEQVEIIVSGCGEADDPAGCETGIRAWWPQMGNNLINIDDIVLLNIY